MPELPVKKLHWFLWAWTHRRRYLAALAAPGACRVRLDGSPDAPVDEAARRAALAALAAKARGPGERVVTPRRGNAQDQSDAPAGRQRGPDRHSPPA
jgi:sRNA-binding protein